MGTFPDNGDVPYLSNRLKGVDNPDGSITEYEFDSCGNIKLEYCVTDRYTEKTSFFYDSENRLLMKDGASAVTMQYDKNGNLIKRTDGIGQAAAVSHFGYDAFGRLTSFSSDSANAKYTYNPEGMRSGKTVNEISTRYIYDNGNILSSVSDGSYTSYNRGTELISVSQYGKEKLYYQTDSHGDVTALHTPDGTEAHSYQYTAYGDEVRAAHPSFGENVTSQLWQTEVTADQNPFRYCGEYTDPETGLIYLRNRYYDPTVGRFISEDPAKDGMNWYVYCGNNPVNFTDPLGLENIVISGGAFHTGNSKYQYAFVDTALKQIKDIGGATLLVSTAGWKSEEKDYIGDNGDVPYLSYFGINTKRECEKSNFSHSLLFLEPFTCKAPAPYALSAALLLHRLHF